jgi:hypothetical protein
MAPISKWRAIWESSGFALFRAPLAGAHPLHWPAMCQACARTIADPRWFHGRDAHRWQTYRPGQWLQRDGLSATMTDAIEVRSSESPVTRAWLISNLSRKARYWRRVMAVRSGLGRMLTRALRHTWHTSWLASRRWQWLFETQEPGGRRRLPRIAAEPRPSAAVSTARWVWQDGSLATRCRHGLSVVYGCRLDPDASVSTDVATPLDGVGLDSTTAG